MTTDVVDDFVIYDPEAVAPLARLGWSVDDVPWRSLADWSRYDLVVIRSPWDYQDDPEAFLDVLAQIDASKARLENPLPVVRWNLRKTYLRDLEAAGVRIVPTVWGEGLTADRLGDLFGAWDAREAVVKPVVGANADDAFRLGAGGLGAGGAWDEAVSTFADRAFMAQPFVHAVVDEGEFSVFVFGGAVSHAILKTPASGDFRVQEEHGGRIQGVAPEAALLALTEAALAAVPHSDPLLYARVDAVRMPDGGFAVMELELIEPSLYFPYGPGSATRFAEAVAALG
ncbi:MAG: hypothetical protein AAF845_03010 [Bacteroidota bacterium]